MHLLMPQIAANEFCGDVSRHSTSPSNGNGNNNNENVQSATFNDDFMQVPPINSMLKYCIINVAASTIQQSDFAHLIHNQLAASWRLLKQLATGCVAAVDTSDPDGRTDKRTDR